MPLCVFVVIDSIRPLIFFCSSRFALRMANKRRSTELTSFFFGHAKVASRRLRLCNLSLSLSLSLSVSAAQISLRFRPRIGPPFDPPALDFVVVSTATRRIETDARPSSAAFHWLHLVHYGTQTDVRTVQRGRGRPLAARLNKDGRSIIVQRRLRRAERRGA